VLQKLGEFFVAVEALRLAWLDTFAAGIPQLNREYYCRFSVHCLREGALRRDDEK